MKKLILFIGVLILGINANSQNSIIKGRVIDGYDLPLPGATIKIEDTNYGTSTDFNGFFTLVKIAEGNYKLTISYIGFESKTVEIEVELGKTIELNFRLQPGVLLNEVLIGAQIQGQAKALNQQKSSNTISNIISSDQVGKFPDANVGDALKRIPGINVQNDQGEARFAHVRGTEPRLNSVSINGERIPSAEGGTRAVQLDLIPSDMIQTIEVTKTLTADMDADAIGGAINLITRSAPSSTRFSGTLGSGYNLISESATVNGSIVLASRFLNNKLGVVFSGSYFDNPLGSDNVEAEWELDNNGNAFTTDFQVRQYDVQRIRKSLSLSLDYDINEKHSIFISGIYNHRNDWENRYRRRYKDIEFDEGDNKWYTEIRRQTKGGSNNEKYARLEDQRTTSTRFGGNHLLGNIEINWSGAFAKASEKRPNERYVSYRAKDVEVIPDFSNSEKPSFIIVDPSYADFSSEFGLKELTEENKYTDEKDFNAKIDIKIPILTGKYKNSIKTGVRYRGKDKKRDNDFFEYEPLDEDAFDALVLNNLADKTKDNFLAGDYEAGHFVSEKFLGNLELNSTSLFDKSIVNEELAGNYTANETITAGYVMLEQNLGENLFANIGFRIENTSLESQGYEYDADNDELIQTPIAKDEYTNYLPSIQFKYNLTPERILRFAFTNTLSRPNYYDLVPYKEVSLEDNEIKIGNPTLSPTTSLNLDLMFENYYKNVGVFSIGTFYKNISDFIVEVERRDFNYGGNVWDKYSQPLNGGNATILGAEISFQRNFKFLSGLGVYTNYTYIHSKVKDFQIEGRENEDLALPGTPDNTLNVSLSYERKGFNIRVSGNWADEFRDSEGIGEDKFYDRWYDSAFHLDINAYYAFAKNWKIFVDATNLTNQPLRYYQGISERTMQVEYYNARFSLGVKFDLSLNK